MKILKRIRRLLDAWPFDWFVLDEEDDFDDRLTVLFHGFYGILHPSIQNWEG